VAQPFRRKFGGKRNVQSACALNTRYNGYENIQVVL
jgi:hypothetical protein